MNSVFLTTNRNSDKVKPFIPTLMFRPKEITEKIFANKVRNNFPTADVRFEFYRLQKEKRELKRALDQGTEKKQLAGEFADVAIFSMAIAKMKNIDAEMLFANVEIEYSFVRKGISDFKALNNKIKELKKALEGDDEDQGYITVAIIELIGHLSVMAETNGIDLKIAIEEKVAYNATRVYTRA